MTFIRLILALACVLSGALLAQEAKVTQLMSKDLTNIPGKEGLMITVESPARRFGPYTSPQCARVCLRGRRLDRDAGDRRKGNDSDPW